MLEGLSEEQAKKCADYFEYMAIWILKNGEAVITDDKLFGLVVFPAIKKIVRNDNGFSDALFNCRKIYDLYKEICYEELKQKDEEIVLKMVEKLSEK